MSLTHSNIYDVAFLGTLLTAENHWLFLQKSFILDVRLGSKYATDFHNNNEMSLVV